MLHWHIFFNIAPPPLARQAPKRTKVDRSMDDQNSGLRRSHRQSSHDDFALKRKTPHVLTHEQQEPSHDNTNERKHHHQTQPAAKKHTKQTNDQQLLATNWARSYSVLLAVKKEKKTDLGMPPGASTYTRHSLFSSACSTTLGRHLERCCRPAAKDTCGDSKGTCGDSDGSGVLLGSLDSLGGLVFRQEARLELLHTCKCETWGGGGGLVGHYNT